MTGTSTSASRCASARTTPRFPASRSVYQGANWWRALLLGLLRHPLQRATPTCAASSCTRSSRATRCARTTRCASRQPLIPERPINDIFRGPGTTGVWPDRPNGHTPTSRQTRATPTHERRPELEAHLQTQADAGQPGAVAPGDARHRAHAWSSSTARPSSTIDPEIGFLHRGFQKSCENVTWTQCLPVHRPAQLRVGAHEQRRLPQAVEKLMRPRDPRARQVHPRHRLRAAPDAATTSPASARIGLELGALHRLPLRHRGPRAASGTGVTELTGARLTTSYGRVGGAEPRPARRAGSRRCCKTLDKIDELRDEVDALLTRNRIFVDRMPRHRRHHRARTRSTSASPAPACAPPA